MRDSVRGFAPMFVLAGLLWAPVAWPCATAPPEGARIGIVAEDALIVWDPETKTEDFIRRASFQSTSPSFGFIVPTPAQPELSEVSAELFVELERAIAPRVVKESRVEWVPFSFLLCMRGTAGSPAPAGEPPPTSAVTVFEQTSVAGYQASVLKATDADVLGSWLKANDYAWSDRLRDWAQRYVEQGWFLTAFKLDTTGEAAVTGRSIALKAVRLRFQTPEPFYPYREPAPLPPTPEEELYGPLGPYRLLRVWVLAPTRMHGALGAAGGRWPGRVDYASPNAKLPDEVRRMLPASTAWLTYFADESSPRKGTDEVFFATSQFKGEVLPPPIREIDETELPLPLDLVWLVPLVGVVVFVRKRRRNRAAGDGPAPG